MSNLKRFGVSIDEKLLEKFDQIIEGKYINRSEAIRDLIRERIIEEESQQNMQEVVGTLTLIYNHQQRQLPEKLVTIEHNYNCLFKSNLHLYLDAKHCLEVVVMQGKIEKVQKVAKKLGALRGVIYSKLNVSTVNDQF